MDKNKVSLIADTVHGTIQLSEIEMEIISSPIFNRLHDISQNSTAYLTFPANRTKRFEHSIGTMYIAGEMFYYGIMNASDKTKDDFFKQLEDIIKKRIEKLLKDEREPYKANIHDYNYKKSELFKFTDEKFVKGIRVMHQWIPHNVKPEQKYIYMALMQSVRLAGLMHDAGHPPFSHIAEYAMRDMWRHIGDIAEENRSARQQQYYCVLDSYFMNDGELHEKIGNQITDRLLSSIQKPMPDERNAHKTYLSIQLYRVMVKEMTSAILGDKNDFFKTIHRLISGALDADRLDYVTRDVMNSGLKNGKIEYDRLIPRMKLVDIGKSEFFFCPSMKSVSVLEEFFERRWNLYKKVIFHHRVIKTDYLLRDCIRELLELDLQKNVLEENDEKILPYDISGLWKAVEKKPSYDVTFNRLVQWNDGWLMVVLKKAFLELEDSENELLKDKLKELLAGEKHYYSLLKNARMFNEIEKEVIDTFSTQIDFFNDKLQMISTQSLDSDVKKQQISIDPFCDDLKDLFNLIENYSERTYQEKGFILGRVARLIFENYLEDGAFQNLVKLSINDIKDLYKVNDIVVEFKEITSGIQERLILYEQEDTTIPFKEVSNTATNLKLQREYVIPFYIYINIDTPKGVDYTEVRKAIGKAIGANMIKAIEELIDNQLMNNF